MTNKNVVWVIEAKLDGNNYEVYSSRTTRDDARSVARSIIVPTRVVKYGPINK